ncbi:hypothetical protein ACFWBF_20600 [Streptomyces sp. NPDC060028]|uniref:hypothetical protein n=1 Tax=Streptomyces sp. NPDC060028 TaxID=3347041 RepID=UPI0036861AC6
MTGNEGYRVGQIGDNVNVYGGTGNIGQIKNTYNGPQDPQAVYREMIGLIQVLRGQVSAADREVIDESLETVHEGDAAPPGAVRRALGAIAGVAAVVGEVGLPVVEAVRRFLALLGG